MKNEKVLLTYRINKEKKVIRMFPGETIEIDDSIYFLSKKAFDFEWLEIVEDKKEVPNKALTAEDKMKIAKKMMEEYINKQ